MKFLAIAFFPILSAVNLFAEITGVYTYPAGSNGDIQINDNGVFGGISSTTFSGGGASNLDGLSDVIISAPSTNQTLVYNGSSWVNAAQGASFSFAIASFSNGLSSTQEIGTGVWKATGTISFTASYSNGPPTSSTVTFSGWGTPLHLSSPFTSTTSVASVSYPAVAGTVVFTLN